MYSKRIFLVNAYSSFRHYNEYLYDKLSSEGFEIKKTLYVNPDFFSNGGKCSKIRHWFLEIKNVIYLMLHAHRHDIILCWDSHGEARILGLVFFLFAKNLKVISYNCSMDPRKWKKGTLKWRLNRQAFKNIIGTVSSEPQRQAYIDTFDLPEWHFHVLQDSLKDHPERLKSIVDNSDHGYIFSGGGAGRDWNTLIETARLLPQYIFKVATNAANAAMLKNAPKNVEVYCYRYHEFNQLAANATLCFIPLLGSWQGGVTVINDVAYLGKLTVTTDFLGICGYYTNGNDIVVVNQGDAKQAAEKIDYLMQHPNERKAMAARAQERVQDFRFENFWEKMKKEIFTML